MLLLVLLMMPLLPVRAQSTLGAKTKVGFTPLSLYDADTFGVPVFMAGESFWIFTDESSRATLLSPEGRRAASAVVDARPTPLYTFGSRDPHGRWTLTVSNAGGTKTYPLQLEKGKVSKVDLMNTFRLQNDSIWVEGLVSVPLDESIGPHTVVLTRDTPTLAVKEVAASGTVGGLTVYIRLTHSSDRPGRLTLEPYVSELAVPEEEVSSLPPTNITALMWAEAALEFPFLKSQGSLTSIITTPAPVARSRVTRIALTPTPLETLELQVPPLGKVGDGGSAPTRWGSGTIRFYAQFEDSIQITRIPVYLLPDSAGFSIVDEFTSPPLAPSFGFSLRDKVTEAGQYRLYLMSKVNGVQALWNTTVTPPLARITVFNELTQGPLTEYTMSLGGGTTGQTTFESDTYALLGEDGDEAKVAISILGIRFRDGEIKPSTLRLGPLSKQEVHVAAGTVEFRVSDVFGAPVETGELLIFRTGVEGEEFEAGFGWADGGLPAFTIPVGTYAVTVYALGGKANSRFSVETSSTIVDVSVGRLQVTSEQALMSAAFIVIATEILFVYRAWRRVFALGMRIGHSSTAA